MKQQLQVACLLFDKQRQSTSYALRFWIQIILFSFVMTLTLVSENIQGFLEQNLNQLLGADVVLTSGTALSENQLTALASRSTALTLTKQLPVTLSNGDIWQNASLKVVQPNYPLQGQLIISDSPTSVGYVAHTTPSTNEIWLDSRLLSALQVDVGDSLLIGEHRLLVAHIIHHEPDRLMEGHNVQMRAMVNELTYQKLSFEGIKETFRYALLVDDSGFSDIHGWQKQNLPAVTFRSKDSDHPLALFWQRTENFLGLSAIVLFFLAAIALEQIAQIQSRSETYLSAVLQSLGHSKRDNLIISIVRWVISIMLMLPLAIAVSMCFHWFAIKWLGETFEGISWQLEWLSLVKVTLLVVIMFAVFQLPVWLQGIRASVSDLFRQASRMQPKHLNHMVSAIVILIVTLIYADNWLLTLMFSGAVGAVILILLVCSWLILVAGEKFTSGRAGLLSFSFYMLRQRFWVKSAHIVGVGLSAFLLLFTLMFMRDLGESLSKYQRKHDGNVFVSQATEEQFNLISKLAAESKLNIKQAKPYAYAKLIRVNGMTLDDFSAAPSDSKASLGHEIRMHWTDTLPANNILTKGKWWDDPTNAVNQVSVEQEVATDIGLNLGDKLTFIVGQTSVDLTITAIHDVKSGYGSITFWIQVPVALMNSIDVKTYHMASLEVAKSQDKILSEIWRQHPTIRMVSLQSLTERFDQILAIMTKVVSIYSLVIILLAGIVICATASANEIAEKKKNSIILSFGLTRSHCLKLNAIEWGITAIIAAIASIGGTLILGSLIYQSQFKLSYNPQWLVIFFALSLILTFVVAIGLYATKTTLRCSVKQLLAE